MAYDNITIGTILSEKELETRNVNVYNLGLIGVPTGATAVDGSPELQIKSLADVMGGSTFSFESLGTIFGDLTTAERITTNNSKFELGIELSGASSTTTGSADITITGPTNFENRLFLETNTTVNSMAEITSADTLRYVAGYEFGLWATLQFEPGTESDSYIRAGWWDGDDGYTIGFEGGVFGVSRWFAGTQTFIPRSSFNGSQEALNVIDNILLTPENLNIWRIRGGYLGAAPIKFEVVNPEGEILVFHEIEYPNTSIQTHISNTILPVRGEVFNGVSGTDNVTLGTASYNSYFVANLDALNNGRNFSLGETGTATTFARTPYISFRNDPTYQGGLMPSAKTHRVDARLDFFSSTFSGQNKPILVEIIITPSSDATGGTFTDVSIDSVLSYSTDATYNLVGNETVIFTTAIATTADSFELFTKEFNLLLRPGQDALFALTSTSAQDSDWVFSNFWTELF